MNVTENDWRKFNDFIQSISNIFKIGLIDHEKKSIFYPSEIESTFSSYASSMNKDASLFSSYVLPELDCLITEDWDYTYIMRYKNHRMVEALSPHILKSGLQHFSDIRR